VWRLIRYEETETETLGRLYCGNNVEFYTLELSYRENQKNKSCIPVGTYTCKRFTSKRHGLTWRLQDVPGRSGIIIHAGNTHRDTRGCILLGICVGILNGKKAVLKSRKAMTSLRRLFRDVLEVKLTIEDVL
jgi:hypothetical protein